MSKHLNDHRAVIVVSAPSGTGKTTLNQRLARAFADQLEVSVSLTTRKIRPGEIEGHHYHFVSRGQFESAIHSGQMLEWANVHGNLYGTSQAEINRICDLGRTPILEIDVQGWEQARQKLDNALSIFILPPSMGHLWQRLSKRATDDKHERIQRLQNARDEIAAAIDYQNFIVNDDLEVAYLQLKQLVMDRQQAGLNHQDGLKKAQSLIREFEDPEFRRYIES